MPTLILHIDDRPELPDGFVESLAQEGYEFLQITDPEEAIRLVEERPPALVLMEIQLGSCDGLDRLMQAGHNACAVSQVMVAKERR